MKFFKKKFSYFYPILLLIFYTFVRHQFRELAQIISNQVGQATSYFWTLLFLECSYLLLVFFLVKKHSQRQAFQWAKKRQALQAIYGTIFASCAVYWLDYFMSGFVQGRAAIYQIFPRTISPLGMLLLLVLVIFVRPVTEELIFRGALVQAYFNSSSFYVRIWGPAVIYGALHLLAHPFTPVSFLIYILPSLVFGLLYDKTRSLYYPILAHIGLNLIYTLPVLLATLQGLSS